MKRKLPFILLTMAFVGALLFMACSKQSQGSGSAPGYAGEETSTGGNPHASTAGSQTSTT